MRRINLTGMILVLLLCSVGSLFASAADELRDRAKHLRKEASIIAERGNKELGGRLESEAVWLLEAADRQGDRPDISLAGEQRERSKALRKEAAVMAEQGNKELAQRLEHESTWLLDAADRLEVQHLKIRLQELLAKQQKLQETKAPEQELTQLREQISGTERELKQVSGHKSKQGEHRPESQKQVEKLEIATRRIHYLRVAAENLKLAEEHDLAGKLMKQAEAWERDVQEAKKRLAAETRESQEKTAEPGTEVVRDLKAEIERLRTEVQELREKNEKR